MQKRIFLGLAIAALASAGFASAYKSSRPTLTPAQLENLERLSIPEYSIDYDECCKENKGSACIVDGLTVYWDAMGVPC